MWIGTKTKLRALEREDLPLTWKWVNTPEIVAYEAQPFPISMEEERAWFEAALKNERRRILVIEALENARPIGVMYFDLDWRHRSANVSITIGELDAQEKGYGTDAIATVVRQAFEELGLNRLSTSILATNARSIRAFEKAGFTREGVRRQAYLWHGAFQDQVTLGILREEHPSRPR